MTGDAFFHILPHMLGMHGHAHDDHHDHDHEPEAGNDLFMVGFTDYADPDHDYDDHDHGDEDEDFGIIVAKIGTLVGSMYAMWLIGSLMRLSGNGHGHSHGGFETPTQSNTEMVKQENPDEQKLEEVDMGSKSSLPSEVKWSTIWGIMIGDCFHNFVDGIAVGVAWTSGIGAGLGTTIAIMMHEIPHELGDFVLYKKLGLSSRGALGLNVIAALISYGGLYLGLALGEDPTVVDWLLALVAGLFIYIALVDVMPVMQLKPDDPNRWNRFVWQNIGMGLGFAMMVLLGWV